MQFKHPEILWALFLLIIPILIHLFQLRKFKKEAFTNVAFLKQLSLQTRKSSRLKKWLVLLARLLTLACLIFAFAQPYFSNRNIQNTAKETVIYLDNSYSMEMQGNQGPMLQRAVNQLLENIPKTETFSIFTNTESYKNVQLSAIKNELLATPYSGTQLDLNEILLKGNQMFSEKDAVNNFIVISDFQKRTVPENLINSSPYFVQLKPVNKENISIDTVFISKTNVDNYTLEVGLTGETSQTIPISLFNDEVLIAKTTVNFTNTSGTASFTIPAEKIKGKITIDDHALPYDNTLYFSINEPEKVNVLSINESDDAYLKRIFTDDEFQYKSSTLSTLNYNELPEQNLIVLNELTTIPTALKNILTEVHKQGVFILTITSSKSDLNSYNQLFKNLNNTSFENLSVAEKQITNISFNHPLFSNVFEEKVSNFQYPKVSASYPLSGTFNNVISYADSTPFLAENNRVYTFTSSLNKEGSNFQQSPLIVPTMYNIAKQSISLPALYYTIGNSNTFNVKVNLFKDEIVAIENDESSFIPLQQNFGNYTSITTSEMPNTAGNFDVLKDKTPISMVSYNINRNESDLNYLDINTIQPEKSFKDIASVFKNVKSENNVDELWKWFVIFALIFLCIELLILKYFK
ncbi:BatA domain-containing protein [Joostella sp. CR20]|uniref:BatA domain-containing protein n=1 Tax=Joostella sp. CR20 TaxID=2804312 RepID=UPI00313E788F